MAELAIDHHEDPGRAIGMKIQLRLGVLATALSALLAAGLLFSAPAFAWDAVLKDVSASCPPGSDEARVDFTLKLFEKGHSGEVKAFIAIGDEKQEVELLDEAGKPAGSFGKDVEELKLHFLVPSPSEDTTIGLAVVTLFDDLPERHEKPKNVTEVDLKKCVEETTPSNSSSTTTTTTTRAPSTPSTPSNSETPSTEAPNTTEIEQESLPKTGSSAVPMLIAALVMLVGGGAVVYAARSRGRHAK